MNNSSNKNKSERNEQKIESEGNNIFQKVICPFCNSNITMILDYKKIQDKNSDWICLICGHVFEYNKKS